MTSGMGWYLHLLDMTNTTLNMMNDMVATVIVSRFEGSIEVHRGAIVPPAAAAIPAS